MELNSCNDHTWKGALLSESSYVSLGFQLMRKGSYIVCSWKAFLLNESLCECNWKVFLQYVFACASWDWQLQCGSGGTGCNCGPFSQKHPFWAFCGLPKMALQHFSIQIPPLKPPFRHCGNHFGPRKSDFWPFYLFWSFSHWNSHWSRKKVPTWEGKVVEQKQKQFWKPWGKWQNMGACKIGYLKKSEIRIPLLSNNWEWTKRWVVDWHRNTYCGGESGEVINLGCHQAAPLARFQQQYHVFGGYGPI